MNEKRRCWLFYVGDFKNPVKVPLDEEVLAALEACEKIAWEAVIFYVENHAAKF